MKKFTKLLGIVLIIALVMSMGTMALAAPTTTTISVPSSDTHSYKIYQIFTGELSTETDDEGNESQVLANIHWGKNGTGTEGEVVPQTTLETIAAISGTDADKAAALKAYANLTGDAAFTVASGKSVEVPTGYYLIMDATAAADLEDGDEATLYIVQVVGPTEITRKASNTTSDKTVDDVNDSDTSVAADNVKKTTSSDYDIGDDVPYHLTATLSEKVEQYKKYHITFTDVLEAGKFDSISELTIKMNGEEIEATDNYTVTITGADAATKDGFEVTIEFAPKEGKTLESLNKAEITIDFTAKLGTGAAIGAEGNKNTLNVSYSNNPNDETGGEEGTTPEKEVITFTYKVVVNKVDENQDPLAGAAFTLYKVAADTAAPTGDDAKDAAAMNTYWASKQIQTWTTEAKAPSAAGTDASSVANQFTFTGIDDGKYVLCETTTPTGYNTIEPQVFTVTASHGGDDGLTLTDLNGNKVSGTIEFTKDVTAGSLTTTIQNQSGTVLPSTGGIGTTIFYVVGSILVVAAGVLLITKKRMSREG